MAQSKSELQRIEGSQPAMEPWLIPETHMSGFLFKISFTPNFIQSAGVPEHEYSICGPLSILIKLHSNVELTVIAWPIPDCGLSGATTTTSPILFITEINDLIPGADIPSSLVTKIKGFLYIIKFE